MYTEINSRQLFFFASLLTSTNHIILGFLLLCAVHPTSLARYYENAVWQSPAIRGGLFQTLPRPILLWGWWGDTKMLLMPVWSGFDGSLAWFSVLVCDRFLVTKLSHNVRLCLAKKLMPEAALECRAVLFVDAVNASMNCGPTAK